MSITVSVIIPVYNTEKYLRQCLDSVLAQTLTEIEIICVDDLSTDDSALILNEYCKKDNKIKTIFNDYNQGQAYSRNKGLDIAKGEYICFLDSDDMIKPQTLQELYHFGKTQDLDGIFFDALDIYQDDEMREKFGGIAWKHYCNYSGVYTGKNMYTEFLKNHELIAAIGLQFWKRSYLEQNNSRFYEGIVHEDILFTFNQLMNAQRVSYIKQDYYIYRHRAESTISATPGIGRVKGYLRCYLEILKAWYSLQTISEQDRAIETQLKSLHFNIKRYYKMFSNITQEDLGLKNNLERYLFTELISKQTIELDRTIVLSEERKELIKSYENIIIFGAGKIGTMVMKALDEINCPIIAFAVTDKNENPKCILGHRVLNIEELIEYKKNGLIIIGTLLGKMDSIYKNLRKLGFENIMKGLEETNEN